jgi:hypothetical protein
LKIPKRELKRQNELLALTKKDTLTADEIEQIYTEFNPAIINDISTDGVYFTPDGLASDAALFTYRDGHLIDVCAGIGALSYNCLMRDSYEKNIKSITCIEYNPRFVEIGKKLLPQANWICGSAFDESLWTGLTKDLLDNRFDCMISNPPFGVTQVKDDSTDWLNYQGHRDLMVLELCLRYAKNGNFILPSGSVPFEYSGRPYYRNEPDRWSQKLKKFLKDNKQHKFTMQCDGIDCSIYSDQWQNLNGIGVECVDISIHPFSLYDVSDSITAINI